MRVFSLHPAEFGLQSYSDTANKQTLFQLPVQECLQLCWLATNIQNNFGDSIFGCGTRQTCETQQCKPDATAQRQNNKYNILMGLTPAVCFVPNKQPYCLATPHNLPCSSCLFTLSNHLSFVHSHHQQLLDRACVFIVFNSKDM